MKKHLVLILIYVCFVAVSNAQPKQGIWRGVLILSAEKQLELPFNFDIRIAAKGKSQLFIHNAEERLAVDEIFMTKDSFNFKMPIFDTEFKTRLIGDTLLTGVWINHTKKENNTISFKATFGNPSRFISASTTEGNFFESKWEVTFSPRTKDSTKAIGQFKYINANQITGTFLTETGDYRYLEGIEESGRLQLSCFDGSHAFLFTAEKDGQSITNGHFYSGSSWQEPWEGKRNPGFELRDAEKLTYLKSASEKVDFSFKNTENQIISLHDNAFKDKVIIIQIMGTWCPNCMDETAYLAKLYKQYGKNGLEIIGLAYERTTEFEKAKNNILRLKKRLAVDYPILITGVTGREKASESLPFLNSVMAFPTTLILDRDHKVVSIYTGFSGPATGKAFEAYTFKTDNLLKELLLKK